MRSDNVEMKRQGQAAGVYSLRGFLLRHCGPVGYTQHFLGQSCRSYVENALVFDAGVAEKSNEQRVLERRSRENEDRS